MNSTHDSMIQLIQEQLHPAIGCTEPAAAAYAAAVAAQALGIHPERITASVSANILKNAMGVGIPGTGTVGLPIAIALGALCGDASARLAVLCRVTPHDVQQAKALLAKGCVCVQLAAVPQRLFIDVCVAAGGHTARVVIADAHTNIVQIEKDGFSLTNAPLKSSEQQPVSIQLSLREIDDFVRSVPAERLAFLQSCISMNEAIAQEGLKNDYGMAIGRSMYQHFSARMTEEQYAQALTCAAADARMGGCLMPVMTSCGSGNQGLTATLPTIAVARMHQLKDELLYRALCYSLLVTIHVKSHLGRLSALCACSVGASIGTACALTYLGGGNFQQIGYCIDNVIADVSGVICDGAKAGCSLKIATGVASAFRSAMLALSNRSASVHDGIVGLSPEASVDNLASLCNTGMTQTDQVILNMLVRK